MSSYTTQLKTLIEQHSQYDPCLSTKERIEIGRKKLFDFDYPIFDSNYKKVFETNFIRNFYMNEIGFEVEGLFKFKLETWLLINMPYFNQLFESELIEYNPLFNVDLKEDYNLKKNKKQDDIRDITQNTTMDQNEKLNGTSKADTTANTTNDNFTRDIESDTPQDRLQLTATDGEGVILYASRIGEQTNNQKGTAKENQNQTVQNTTDTNAKASLLSNDAFDSTINSVDDYLRHLVGKQGNQSYSAMINEYRSTFLRIERDLFYEMKELFMLVY